MLADFAAMLFTVLIAAPPNVLLSVPPFLADIQLVLNDEFLTPLTLLHGHSIPNELSTILAPRHWLAPPRSHPSPPSTMSPIRHAPTPCAPLATVAIVPPCSRLHDPLLRFGPRQHLLPYRVRSCKCCEQGRDTGTHVLLTLDSQLHTLSSLRVSLVCTMSHLLIVIDSIPAVRTTGQGRQD